MSFNHPTYIVLDVPPPAAGNVQFLRSWFDAGRAALPVEITVAGSSGLGTIAGTEGPGKVFGILAETAAKLKPFRSAFEKVERFPGTEIFYFTLSAPEKFHEIHKLVASSGIKFNPTPYPEYKPHCTLKLLSKGSEQEIKDLFETRMMSGDFLIDTLSVYSLVDERYPERLFSVKLGSQAST